MNLTDCEGFLRGKQHLLLDRDTKFCAAFQEVLRREGIESKLLSPRSPNLNAHIERFMRSVKEECLDRMIFFATVRLQTHKTKGSGSRTACLTIVSKLMLSTQKKWRVLNGAALIPEVTQGVKFIDGVKQTEVTAWHS